MSYEEGDVIEVLDLLNDEYYIGLLKDKKAVFYRRHFAELKDPDKHYTAGGDIVEMEYVKPAQDDNVPISPTSTTSDEEAPLNL